MANKIKEKKEKTYSLAEVNKLTTYYNKATKEIADERDEYYFLLQEILYKEEDYNDLINRAKRKVKRQR